EDAGKLDMITLNHQDRVGEQRIDQRRVPHQVPAFLRLAPEALKLLARHGEAMIEAEGLEVSHVAIQNRLKRFAVQKADVVALMEGVDQDLPVHRLGDHAPVVEGPGLEAERAKLGPEFAKPSIDVEPARAIRRRGGNDPYQTMLLA